MLNSAEFFYLIGLGFAKYVACFAELNLTSDLKVEILKNKLNCEKKKKIKHISERVSNYNPEEKLLKPKFI